MVDPPTQQYLIDHGHTITYHVIGRYYTATLVNQDAFGRKCAHHHRTENGAWECTRRRYALTARAAQS